MPGLESPLHLIIILVIVLIVFGPGKLPEIGAGLGRAIRSFKEAVSEHDAIAAAATKEREPAAEKKDVKS